MKESTDQMIAILRSFKDGETIQTRDKYNTSGSQEWVNVYAPKWNFGVSEYRVLPKPKSIWVNEYSNGKSCSHYSKEMALRFVNMNTVERPAVEYREVI